MALRPTTNLTIKLLDAAPAAEPGEDWFFTGGCVRHAIQVVNPDSATVRIYASSDEANWVQVGDDISTHAYFHLPAGIYPYLKAVRDESTTGTVTVFLNLGQPQD